MNKNIFIWSILFVVLASCGSNATSKMDANSNKATPVIAVKVPTKDFTTFNTYPVSIEGVVNSEVRPKISGYITKVYVDEGQKVKKGQLLFTLETETLNQQAAAGKASINAAQVQVDQLKPLVEKGIVGASQLEAAKAQLELAKSNYQGVVANIDYANIKSPIDGFVGKIRIRKGNLVTPTTTEPLTVVSNIEQVYGYFSMNEKEYLDFLMSSKGETRAEKVKNLPDVTLVMANGEEFKNKGTIETVNSQIDETTGSVSFRAIFENPNFLLTNGSTGKVKIPKTYNDVVVVPRKSTYEQQGYTYVVKVKKSDSGIVAETKVIEVLDKTESLYMVGSGIENGDEIVAYNPASIRTGTSLSPKEIVFDSVAKPIPVLF